MVKASQKDGYSATAKQKVRIRNSTCRYLKPGDLAKLWYAKSSSKSCSNGDKSYVKPVTHSNTSITPPVDFPQSDPILSTPKPSNLDSDNSDSKLLSLPMDLLVKIMCCLHHDQLRAVFHVSQKIRKAVLIARQFHFNYTTPDRSRQELLNTNTPKPSDHWPFRGGMRGSYKNSPVAPRAPRHGPRPALRIASPELKQIAATLFPDGDFSSRYIVPSALKPAVASNRVLFYER